MAILIFILAWLSGVTCGIAAALVLREYFLRRPGSLPVPDSLPKDDDHERMKWPAHFDR